VKIDKLRGKIEFRDVWFRYPTRKEQWIFKGLNLTINPNESMAVVGESGSGKSTFVNLLLRFYDPDMGEVLVDDVNIKNYDLQEYRRKLGLVMQEPTLFNYTIKENILYGSSLATNSKILEAAQVANATEFIENSQIMEELVDDSPQGLLQYYTGYK
jgi:ATP-binding cassette subfamily B (MDR/TAP) protein 1